MTKDLGTAGPAMPSILVDKKRVELFIYKLIRQADSPAAMAKVTQRA